MAAAPKIALRRIVDLTPDPRNARTHSPEQVEQLVASIERFGWTNPVLADDLIRAGHGRVMAATSIYDQGGTIYMAPGKERGGTALPAGTVPVIDCTGWTDEERKAYSLADNQLALQAGWDLDELTAQLDELAAANFDIATIGFDQAALDALAVGKVQTEGQTDPDDVTDPPENPAALPGDMWQLGAHLLICGDSTDSECVGRLLDGEKPMLMVTDPPYGVNYDPSWRMRAGVSMNKAKMGTVLNDDRADWREAWELFPGDVAYVWHGALHARAVAESLESCGFQIRAEIIWAKDRFALGRGDYHWHHEPALYAVRNRAHWEGGRDKSTLWTIPAREDSGHGHGTQKPVECMRRPIENNSKRGDAVYEPFSGSGTTIIAAEIMGRRCLAVELNPAYVDLAIERWQQYTGREATLVGDGRTFDAVARERLGDGPAEAETAEPAVAAS